MTELFFIAFPIATIIFAIALQKIFRSPILVAAIIFAIFLIVTFAVFDATFLINTIIYTIIAFITAFLVCLICRWGSQNNNNHQNSCTGIGSADASVINDTSNNNDNSSNCGSSNGCLNYSCNRGYNMPVSKYNRMLR